MSHLKSITETKEKNAVGGDMLPVIVDQGVSQVAPPLPPRLPARTLDELGCEPVRWNIFCFRMRGNIKLDGVGLVDNKPFTD